jgi:hypothetical protein
MNSQLMLEIVCKLLQDMVFLQGVCEARNVSGLHVLDASGLHKLGVLCGLIVDSLDVCGLMVG